jgi:hypothetical protein
MRTVNVTENTDLNNLNTDNNSLDLKEILKSVEVDPLAEIPEPPIVLKINSATVCTLGNFSLIIGKAKSKKTFLLSVLLSACVNNNRFMENIESIVPTDGMVLFFDTEQSEYHLSRTIKRICKMAEIKNPANFKAYGLRKFTPIERLTLIEYAIHKTSNLSIVCIDGLRDLLTNGINDEAEATTKAGQPDHIWPD